MVDTANGAYRFTPNTCTIYNDGGTYDIEIGGVVEAPDGEVFYFELSSTGNHVDIELGADGPFVSTDRGLKAGQYVSEPFKINVSGQVISVPVIVLVDELGRTFDAASSLTIDYG